jgi:Concanavalin A-like lectin/glucanases superfamily
MPVRARLAVLAFAMSQSFAQPAELSQTPLASDPSLVSYYRFEGSSADSKGINNGTDVDMVYGTTYGKFGQGAHFNGTGGRIQKPNPAGLPTGNHDVSFTAWIRPSSGQQSAPGTAVIGGFGTANPAQYASFGFDGGIYWGGYNNDANVSFSKSLDTWYMLTATYTASDMTVRFYVNGSPQGPTRIIGTPNITLTRSLTA